MAIPVTWDYNLEEIDSLSCSGKFRVYNPFEVSINIGGEIVLKCKSQGFLKDRYWVDRYQGVSPMIDGTKILLKSSYTKKSHNCNEPIILHKFASSVSGNTEFSFWAAHEYTYADIEIYCPDGVFKQYGEIFQLMATSLDIKCEVDTTMMPIAKPSGKITDE